ncbi:hypothetical protein FQN54_003934 [Arachnomyces sp. PD_36]|nr:hypothetical protein FQN54_003934 [Arachnomyces sp. PD_36]
MSSGETALLDLATKAGGGGHDVLALSDKEAMILQLYDQMQERELEIALLEQDSDDEPSMGNIDEEIAVAERELLEARATYTVRKKAIETVLMTDPILKSVHSTTATSPVQRALLPLINRRDTLSLIHESLSSAHSSTTAALSDAEVENIAITKRNQELARTLLELTEREKSLQEEVTDGELKTQLDALKAESKTEKAKWETIKSVVSAMVAASGVDWARDEDLQRLVLDESVDD